MDSIKNIDVIKGAIVLCDRTLQTLDYSFEKLYRVLSPLDKIEMTKYVGKWMDDDMKTIQTYVKNLFDSVLNQTNNLIIGQINIDDAIKDLEKEAHKGLMEWGKLMMDRAYNYLSDNPSLIAGMLSPKFQNGKGYTPYYDVLALKKLLMELEETI